jgi:hypothetical protein
MQQTWRRYAVGFATMAIIMILAGGALATITLTTPDFSGSTPPSEWLIRAGVAVILGLLAAGFSMWALRHSRIPVAPPPENSAPRS